MTQSCLCVSLQVGVAAGGEGQLKCVRSDARWGVHEVKRFAFDRLGRRSQKWNQETWSTWKVVGYAVQRPIKLDLNLELGAGNGEQWKLASWQCCTCTIFLVWRFDGGSLLRMRLELQMEPTSGALLMEHFRTCGQKDHTFGLSIETHGSRWQTEKKCPWQLFCFQGMKELTECHVAEQRERNIPYAKILT